MKTHQGFGTFKLGIKVVGKSDTFHKMNETNHEFIKKERSFSKIEGGL
jgi:hypothetical protein